MLIKSYENTILTTLNLCVLLFIGNEERGNQVIDMLIEYKKHEIYNVCICFNSEKLYNIFKGKVISKFDNYRIYICNELANDIVPT